MRGRLSAGPGWAETSPGSADDDDYVRRRSLTSHVLPSHPGFPPPYRPHPPFRGRQVRYHLGAAALLRAPSVLAAAAAAGVLLLLGLHRRLGRADPVRVLVARFRAVHARRVAERRAVAAAWAAFRAAGAAGDREALAAAKTRKRARPGLEGWGGKGAAGRGRDRERVKAGKVELGRGWMGGRWSWVGGEGERG
jgi:hypothetical protein